MKAVCRYISFVRDDVLTRRRNLQWQNGARFSTVFHGNTISRKIPADGESIWISVKGAEEGSLKPCKYLNEKRPSICTPPFKEIFLRGCTSETLKNGRTRSRGATQLLRNFYTVSHFLSDHAPKQKHPSRWIVAGSLIVRAIKAERRRMQVWRKVQKPFGRFTESAGSLRYRYDAKLRRGRFLLAAHESRRRGVFFATFLHWLGNNVTR